MTATQRKKDGNESSAVGGTGTAVAGVVEAAAAAVASHHKSQNELNEVTMTAVNNTHNKTRKIAPPPTILEWSALIGLVVLTYVFMPNPLHPVGEPSIHHVFYYGWITAVSTGLGIVPLIFTPNLASYWVGVSNGTRNEKGRLLLLYCRFLGFTVFLK